MTAGGQRVVDNDGIILRRVQRAKALVGEDERLKNPAAFTFELSF